MNKPILLFLIPVATFFLVISGIAANSPKYEDTRPRMRMATVVDTAGVKTEVKKICCYDTNACFGSLDTFYQSAGQITCFSLSVSNYVVGIPMSHLISVSRSENKVEATYHWRGTQRTISGRAHGQTLKGSSAFGEFELSCEKLKQLYFEGAPETKPLQTNVNRLNLDAKVVLTNGLQLTLNRVERYSLVADVDRFSGSLSTWLNDFEDFKYVRGESRTKIGFKEIRKLEFGQNNTVTVTLRTGVSASGKYDSGQNTGATGSVAIIDGTGGAVYGWFGEDDEGIVNYPVGIVRSIEFLDPPAKEKK